MNTTIRILHVIGAMGSGGAEAMIMNIYRNIDRTKIQFDFVVHTNKKEFYDDEILSLGGKIFHTERYNILNYLQYKRFWDDFFTDHDEYHIIHGHINSSAAIYLKSAKEHNRIAVVHSHATRNSEKSMRKCAFLISSYPIRYIADFFFACSKKAGIDRFGKRIVKSKRFCVLNNGIDTNSYKYNYQKRIQIRNRFNIKDNTVVIGHVGRFTYAKNHRFLIDIFSSIHRAEPNSILMLVGIGELEEEIREQVKTLGLENAVLFLGQTNNVGLVLQAIDVFIFPSLFEGLGIALVEAQAAGLPCIVSENIQKEADIKAGLVHYLKVNDGKEKWAQKAIELRNVERYDITNQVKKAGFDIFDCVNYLETFYERHWSDIQNYYE